MLILYTQTNNSRILKVNRICIRSLDMVDSKKIPNIVIEQLRAAILDGLYRPEERLLEAEVAAQFRVTCPHCERPSRR